MARLSLQDKSITIGGQELRYTLRTNSRARSVRLEIAPSGLVAVRPPWVAQWRVEEFIMEKQDWIMSKLVEQSARREEAEPMMEPFSETEKRVFKRQAAHLIIERLEYFNRYYRLEYRRISVREQKTRWGSCSRDKALSFNLRLYFVPERLLDYVVVHELCHLAEMNHGPAFWKLVSETIPDYQERRRELKKQII